MRGGLIHASITFYVRSGGACNKVRAGSPNLNSNPFGLMHADASSIHPICVRDATAQSPSFIRGSLMPISAPYRGDRPPLFIQRSRPTPVFHQPDARSITP